MQITDMKPADFVDALAQIEAEAAASKIRGDSDFVAVNIDVAMDLVRIATSVIRTEIGMRKFTKGFGYKKASDEWAMALEAEGVTTEPPTNVSG